MALEAAMEVGVETGVEALEAGVEALEVGVEMASSRGKLQLGPGITGEAMEAAQQHLRWPLLTMILN